METATTTKHGIEKLASDLYAQAGPGSEEPAPGEWRRGAGRRVIRVPVEIECPGKRAMRAHTLNVSPDSMCVLSRDRLGAHERVRVRLAHEPGAAWHAAAVVHCTETVGGFKVGLKAD